MIQKLILKMTRWFNEYHYHIIIKEKEEQRIADSR